MPLKRDVGKLKKQGFLRGTQAYRWRTIFAIGGCLYTLAFGFTLYYFYDPEESRATKWLNKENEMKERHQSKIEAIIRKRQKLEEMDRKSASEVN